MTVVLARVDNRLIHGQVLETWIPRTNTSVVLVVDEHVACDSLRQAIMEIAVPSSIKCRFFNVDQLKGYMSNGNSVSERIMILFSEIKTARDALETGLSLSILNIGNLHYEQGKKRITSSVSLDEEEIDWLTELNGRIQVDVRATPDDPMVSFAKLIENAETNALHDGGRSGWRSRWPFSLFG